MSTKSVQNAPKAKKKLIFTDNSGNAISKQSLDSYAEQAHGMLLSLYNTANAKPETYSDELKEILKEDPNFKNLLDEVKLFVDYSNKFENPEKETPKSQQGKVLNLSGPTSKRLTALLMGIMMGFDGVKLNTNGVNLQSATGEQKSVILGFGAAKKFKDMPLNRYTIAKTLQLAIENSGHLVNLDINKTLDAFKNIRTASNTNSIKVS